MKLTPTIPALILAASIAGASTAVAVAPTSADTTRRVSFCTSEDDQRGPCVWDALHQGNHKGRSFIRHTDGTVTYLAPRQPVRAGEVLTRTGRIVRMHAEDPHAGCFFFRYVELIDGYPGDRHAGLWFCNN